MDFLTLGMLVAGLIILTWGADFLVKGAAHLANTLGISPLIIGLTVVAFGTSAPEMAVSTVSAWGGQADIAVGNVVGSNIFNVLFILGLSALVAPLVVSAQLVRFDVPIMIAASFLFYFIAKDGLISRSESAVLFTGVVAYTVFLIDLSRKEKADVQQELSATLDLEEPDHKPHWAKNVGLVLIGLVMLVLGSTWLVEGAIAIARYFEVSELIIGLTIVAAGTSLPELATSVMASIKGERDIAVGNVVGSCIFNLLAVLGIAGLITPVGINVSSTALAFDIPVMIAVALICLPIFFIGYNISRANGAMLFVLYLSYTGYLIFAAQQHPALETLKQAVVFGAVPITILMLVFEFVQWRRGGVVESD